MTEDDKISLREYFEMLMEERDKALSIQASEYSRRLDELNHEKESIKDIQRSYVLQETFDARIKDADSQLRILNTFKDRIAGQVALYPAVALVIGIIVSIILHFWR